MQAAVVPAVGSPWQIEDVPRPEPGPGQVRLLGFVVGTVGKGVLEKAFVNSVKAIGARSGAASTRMAS